MNVAGSSETVLSSSNVTSPPPPGLSERAANDAAPAARAAAHRRAAPRVGCRSLPVSGALSAYRGVAARVRQANGAPVFELTLLHRDPARSVPLVAGCEAASVARAWRAWAEALSLPLIAVDADGSVRGELTAFGALYAERPSPRRKGSALVGRRSRYGRRRRAMAPMQPLTPAPACADREIVAPN